eukprot:TRINITY_DN2356_c0_g1_i3.p1 TRINITY_DN2356_c0_g1~~TRINITY_DN2356_c0_g1_i3.p1  ORF type:complete len:1556 (-),score=486.31 TRINITY_DN2356_c0_g1_i3:1298-5965(-)
MELDRVWIPSEEEGWVSASVVSDNGNELTVLNEFINEEETINKKDVVLLQEQSLKVLADMIALSDLHEATLLYNLRERYKEEKIYTYIGPMIVSVNPFKHLPIYDESLIHEYLSKQRDELEPHLFAIAQKAWQSLRQQGQSQSVVISGESGAGKTEATKVVLKFLTFVASLSTNSKSGDGDLASRILATNPVLEAFGNAKTVRNNNSSRFGKFIKIAFDYETGKILGARIDNYLLEQTRVVGQAPNERNYHIFYQLIYGASPEEKEKYHLLDSADDYLFLSNGHMNVRGIDDEQDFLLTKKAMTTLGIKEQEQEEYFSVLSGILLLGNVQFEGEERVDVKDLTLIDIICSLLKVYAGPLRVTLTSRKFTGGARSSEVKIPLSYDQAIENRDALCKAIYSRMFDHLVSQLNTHLILGSSFPEKSKFIGVLDIYGFEKFKLNSLEQFCINYANEKLHQQFNEHMFKAEQQEYTKEGVEWTEISFVDNKPTIDLIEKSTTGVLAMLDEECRMPKGSDQTYLEKLRKSKSMCKEIRFDMKIPDEFTIVHYAEPVPYDVKGFLSKNKDTLFADVITLMSGSFSTLVKTLFKEEGSSESDDSSGGNNAGSRASLNISAMRSARVRPGPSASSAPKPTGASSSKVTVTKKFSQSLAELVGTLASSHRHYVRCIKPNDTASPITFIGGKVLTQLRSNGVLETVKLRKAGYANRMPHNLFYERYRVMGLDEASSERIRSFLKKTLSSTSDWAIGTTKIFLRDSGLDELEEKRAEKLKANVICLQSYVRRYRAQIKLQKLRIRWQMRNEASGKLQRFIRGWNSRVAYHRALELEKQRKNQAATVIQKFCRAYNAWSDYMFMKDSEFRKRVQNAAALVIQSWIRRNLASKKLNQLIHAEEERKRIELEKQKAEEERKRFEEERKKFEEERKRMEEENRKKLEEERKRAEEEARIREEEERKRKEEERQKRRKEKEEAEARRRQQEEEDRAKLEEERKKFEEARRLMEEQQREKLEEERRKFEDARRLMEEQQREKLEEERKKMEEERRKLEEEDRKRVEAQRIQDEVQRLLEEEKKKLGVTAKGSNQPVQANKKSLTMSSRTNPTTPAASPKPRAGSIRSPQTPTPQPSNTRSPNIRSSTNAAPLSINIRRSASTTPVVGRSVSQAPVTPRGSSSNSSAFTPRGSSGTPRVGTQVSRSNSSRKPTSRRGSEAPAFQRQPQQPEDEDPLPEDDVIDEEYPEDEVASNNSSGDYNYHHDNHHDDDDDNNGENEITYVVHKLVREQKLKISSEKVDNYIELLQENLVSNIQDVLELDSESWMMLSHSGFPVRLRQLLINEAKSRNKTSFAMPQLALQLTSDGSGLDGLKKAASSPLSILSGLFGVLNGPNSVTNLSSNASAKEDMKPTPTEERDIDFLFNISYQIYIRHDFQVSKEISIEMAALWCIVKYGNYDDFLHSFDSVVGSNINSMFPVEYPVNNQMENEVWTIFRSLKNISKKAAQFRFYHNFRTLPSNDGIFRFYVYDNQIDEGDNQWVLGISKNGICNITQLPDEDVIEAEWDYSCLTRWV